MSFVPIWEASDDALNRAATALGWQVKRGAQTSSHHCPMHKEER